MELGHRRLALLVTGTSSSTVRHHERGWTESIGACGLDATMQTVARLPKRGEADEQEALRHLLVGASATEPPTVVLCSNDRRAHHVLLAAASLAIRVPEQLSIISLQREREHTGTSS